MAYSFREIFSIGQNLNHVHMTYSFLELLIFFWLTQEIFIVWSFFLTTSQKYLEYRIWIQTPKETNYEIKTSIFACFFHEIKTNILTWCFNMKLKFLIYFFLLSFISAFSEAAVRRCCRNILNQKETPTEVLFCKYCYFLTTDFL